MMAIGFVVLVVVFLVAGAMSSRQFERLFLWLFWPLMISVVLILWSAFLILWQVAP